jgi:hypothetical protein
MIGVSRQRDLALPGCAIRGVVDFAADHQRAMAPDCPCQLMTARVRLELAFGPANLEQTDHQQHTRSGAILGGPMSQCAPIACQQLIDT